MESVIKTLVDKREDLATERDKLIQATRAAGLNPRYDTVIVGIKRDIAKLGRAITALRAQ